MGGMTFGMTFDGVMRVMRVCLGKYYQLNEAKAASGGGAAGVITGEASKDLLPAGGLHNKGKGGKGGKAIKCTRHGGGSRCQQEAVSHPHEDAAPWDAGCDGVRRFPKVRLDGCACPKTSGTHSIMCDDHYSLLMSRLVLDQRHCRMESVARWPAWRNPDCQFIQPPRVQSQPIPSIDVVDDITTPPFWLPEQVDVVITPYS